MKYIAIDFDGTCVTHRFPDIGESIGAERVLRKLIKKGHKLILHTSRTDCDSGTVPGFPALPPGKYLTAAVEWFNDRHIELYGVQRHPGQDPRYHNKPFADLILDDAALGCPLKSDKEISPRPFVDWEVVEMYLTGMKYL